jgi:hypothetical protein
MPPLIVLFNGSLLSRSKSDNHRHDLGGILISLGFGNRTPLSPSVDKIGNCDANPQEVLMRIMAFAILAIGTGSIGPAGAQTYDPAYPVCLHVYTLGANYYECRYTSLPSDRVCIEHMQPLAA